MFDGCTLLITGGTGSFGHAVLRRFLNSNLKEIRIFSRDEKKQDDQRRLFQSDRVKFYIGDVRDAGSILEATRGADLIFHAAALKQVPSCEFYPMEAVRTNIVGTDNVLDASVTNGVSRVVCLSTDKAVYPINAMGQSKALMEKLVVARSRNNDENRNVFCATRYGNVMALRGSVIPLFISQVQSGQPITITDPDMTRFIMSLDEAVDLVLFAFDHAENGDLFVRKAPGVKMRVLAEAILRLMGKEDHPIKIIGTRHGEKKAETLLSREEMITSQDLGDYFRVPPDNRDLNYERFFSSGELGLNEAQDYNSENSGLLNVEQTMEIVGTLGFVRSAIETGKMESSS